MRYVGSRFAVELLALLLLAACAADRGAFGIRDSSTDWSSAEVDPGGSNLSPLPYRFSNSWPRGRPLDGEPRMSVVSSFRDALVAGSRG